MDGKGRVEGTSNVLNPEGVRRQEIGSMGGKRSQIEETSQPTGQTRVLGLRSPRLKP